MENENEVMDEQTYLENEYSREFYQGRRLTQVEQNQNVAVWSMILLFGLLFGGLLVNWSIMLYKYIFN